MIDIYLQIFYAACIALVAIIPVVIGITVLFGYISDLLFRK